MDTSIADANIYLSMMTLSEIEFSHFIALRSIIDGTIIHLFPRIIRVLFNNYVERKAFELCQTDYKNVTPAEAKIKYLALARFVLKQRLGHLYDKIVKL